MSSSNASTGGISGPTLLSLLFIGLKLTHFITWSWLWVLSPIWIPVGVVLLAAFVALLVIVFKK